jgi:hypothetical protein
MAAQTGEVVRNHGVGTWFGSGRSGPEASVATPKREWTPESMSMEGWSGTDEQVADRDVHQVTRTGPIPGEEIGKPTGGQHVALKGSEDQEGWDSNPHREMWTRGRRCSRKPSRVTGRPERPRRARERQTTRYDDSVGDLMRIERNACTPQP